MQNKIATMKNATSRKKGLLATLKGRTIAIEPATTATMNEAAPMSSPTASDPELIFIAAKVLKTSGDPLPKAKNVTPAYTQRLLRFCYIRCDVPTMLSDIPRTLAIVERLMQKKSLAAIPSV